MKNSLCLFLISFFTIFLNAKATTGEQNLLHLKYGQNEQNKLDLFLPESYNERTAVILMLYGGAWMMGGNEYTDKTAKDFRNRGFIVANVDYRYVSNNVHASDLLNDIQSAFEFLKKKGKRYKFSHQGYHLADISA